MAQNGQVTQALNSETQISASDLRLMEQVPALDFEAFLALGRQLSPFLLLRAMLD